MLESDFGGRLARGLSNRYDVVRELGRGAMARVFLARDLKHDRPVAIKVLHSELSGQLGAERFLREIRVTAALQHPHIVPLYDSGEADGLLYYVTSYVEGESLRSRLQRDRVLPVDEAVVMIRTLAMAVDFAHRKGVIHRDIKPENILLQDGQPVLADFGIALALSRASDDRVTATGLSLGTPQYMSPEQATGAPDVGPRSDIYSLGAVAYELLVGEPPVTGPTREAILSRIIVEPPRPIGPVRPTVSHALEAAILKALAKEPVDRFATAASFAAAIDSRLLAPVVSAPPLARQRVSVRVVALAIGIIVLVVATVLLTRLPPRPPAAVFRQLTFSGDVLRAAISPDGRRIAYATRGAPADGQAGDALATHADDFTGSQGDLHVLVREVDGGTPDTLATLRSVLTIDWATDGTKILVAGRRRAVVLSHLGGATRDIEAARTFPAYVLGHWLPDGSRVSLHKFIDKHMLLVNLEDETIDTLPFPGDFTWLEEGSWSPDGRRFAVATRSDNTGRWAIRLVDMSGRSRLIIEDTVPLVAPRWSNTAEALYYLRNGQALVRLRLSSHNGTLGGLPTELHSRLDVLPAPTAYANSHSVARSASRMVYVKGMNFSNFWIVEAGDEGRIARAQRLTTGTALRWSPVVSPDGQWVAFVEQAHGKSELFRMPTFGGRAVQVTTRADVAPFSRIAWSPSGEEIAFTSDRSGRHQVWIANAVTGRVRGFQQTTVSGSTYNLAWAPGAEIAYQRPGNRRIDLLNPASGKVRVLAADSNGTFHSPLYSPDGTGLALIWNRGPDDETLWLFGIADSSQRQIQNAADTLMQRIGATHDWSGNYLYARAAGSLIRIDMANAGRTSLVLRRPFPRFECVPANRRQPSTYICAVFETNSDVWMIENFDSSHR